MKYPVLPVMQCDPNCGECCGVVLCKESEFAAIGSFIEAEAIEPKAQGLTCPFFQGGTCAVYEVRPMVCRLFGHCERLTCPHGYNANIGSARERHIAEKYGTPTRCLHEFIPGWKPEDLAAAF